MRLVAALCSISLAFTFLGCSSNGASGGGADTGGSPSTGGGSPSSGGAGPAGGAGGSSATGGASGGSQGGAGGGGTAGTGGASATGSGGSNATGGAAGSGTGGASAADASATPDAGARDASPAEAAPTVAPPFTASYHIGADITWVQHDEMYGAMYVDTDGVAKDILTLLKNHGFNSVRMRIYVDPRAVDGYDKFDGFGDIAHTVAMGQRIKQAGMGFYLAMHYSDNWADPGKQCVPVAWQQDTMPQLLAHVHDYTLSVMTALEAAGARPDLIQVGNETTPGMLIHLCDANGIPITTGNNINPVNGRITGNGAGWANFGNLLKEGIRAIKEVNTTSKIVLHIDKGGDLAASMNFITQARAQAVPFDVFADTSYVRWQGQPSGWQNTFAMLVTMFPTLSFVIPEYGNETATTPPAPPTMRIANDIIFGIPNNRGIGTWIYEPEHPAQAGIGIGLVMTNRTDAGIADPWPVFTALPAAMTVYDQMKTAYANRL